MSEPLHHKPRAYFGHFAVLLGIGVSIAAITMLLAAPVEYAAEEPGFLLSENLVTNAGFEETSGSKGILAAHWIGHGSGYALDTLSHSGKQSLRMTAASARGVAGARQRVTLNQQHREPVFIGAYVRGEGVTLNEDSWIGASIYAEIHLADGSIVYWNSVRNSGTFDWRWIGFNTGTVPTVDQPIAYIYITPILAEASGTAWFDDITVAAATTAQPAVTFMFDDGLDTVYTEAFPILKQYRFPATIAVITDWVGNNGALSKARLRKLEHNNWEIVSHTRSHAVLTNLEAAAVRSELADAKKRLADWGFETDHIAFPTGAYNAAILAETQHWYRSGRTYESGNNPAGSFPYDLKVRGITPETTSEDVAAWLEDAKKHHAWVILTFHGVHENPREFDTSPERFAEFAKVVQESGIDVITYGSGVDRFTVQENELR